MDKGAIWLLRSSRGKHYDQDSRSEKREEFEQFPDEDKKNR